MDGRFSCADVAKLAELPERRVLSFARAGIVGSRDDEDRAEKPPGKTPFGFDFRDLMVLRAAARLFSRGFPWVRVQRLLSQLRAELPLGRPLSGVAIESRGDKILVQVDGKTWDPESGQLELLPSSNEPNAEAQTSSPDADVAELAELRDLGLYSDASGNDMDAALSSKVALAGSSDVATAERWYALGLDLEEQSPEKAYEAYLRALACDPEHTETLINIGSLCSMGGEAERAAAYFRLAVFTNPSQPIAHYNLAITHHDKGDNTAAISSYRRAIELDHSFADAHFNLAALLDKVGDHRGAQHHWQAYENSRPG